MWFYLLAPLWLLAVILCCLPWFGDIRIGRFGVTALPTSNTTVMMTFTYESEPNAES